MQEKYDNRETVCDEVTFSPQFWNRNIITPLGKVLS